MSRGGSPMRVGEIAAAARGALGEAARRELHESTRYKCVICRRAAVGARPEVCKGCVEDEARERAEERRASRLEQIPRRFRWAHLGLDPFCPPGHARAVVSPRAIEAVRRHPGPVVLLRGETRSGKTSLVCAMARAELEHGADLAFVSCEDVAPDARDQARAASLLIRASQARIVVLDDIGQDLSGAPPGGGLAAYRGARIRGVIREFHRSQAHDSGRKLWITMGIDDDALGNGYGEDIRGRLLEDSPEILELWLSRKPAPRPPTR